MPHEETGEFVAGRNTAIGGKLPMNTNGGGLSYTLQRKCKARKVQYAMATAACLRPAAPSSSQINDNDSRE